MENTPTDNAARNAIYLKFMGQSKDSQVFINIHFLCQHQERQTTPTCSQGRAERGPRERGPWHSAPSRRETGRSRGRREHTERNSALTRATRTHLSKDWCYSHNFRFPEVDPLTRIPNAPQEAGNCRLQTTLSSSPEGRSQDARSSSPPRRPQLRGAASAPCWRS